MGIIGRVSNGSIKFRPNALKSFTEGEIVDCSIMGIRQKNHLDMAHAVCRFAFNNWRDGEFKSYDEFRQFLSIEVGYTRVSVTYMSGKIVPVVIAESWGFSVAEKKFMDKLFNPMMKYLCDYFKCGFEELCSMSQEHKFISGDK